MFRMDFELPDPSEADKLVSEVEFEFEIMVLETYEMAVRVAKEVEDEINNQTSGTTVRIFVNRASKNAITVTTHSSSPEHCKGERYFALVMALDAMDAAMSGEGYRRAS